MSMNMSTGAFEIGNSAPGMNAEVRKILRQNELAFRRFVAVCILVCGLVLLAMFLG
jgi:hypothetical protein